MASVAPLLRIGILPLTAAALLKLNAQAVFLLPVYQMDNTLQHEYAGSILSVSSRSGLVSRRGLGWHTSGGIGFEPFGCRWSKKVNLFFGSG